MPAASQQPVIWTIAIATIILLGAGYFAYTNAVNQIPEIDIPTAQEIIDAADIPTASEVADLIVIPVSPEQDLDEILEGVYPNEVRSLQRDCIRELEREYSEDDVLDLIEDLIEDSEDEAIENLRITDWNFDNDYDFDVINLGLDDEEDRAAEIEGTLRVSYKLEDGNSDTYRDKVYVIATCSDWDKSDDEFDDLSLSLTL